ncbi:hypothetical protein BAE44_0003832 [Dichanthelium oligosanthes]|uniref:Uncharacterized protein n=1 Tax=Dichanthelium oligosanthes TaxID=888268 RepID=A0A1E5WCV6_9POAL|nr:hypothetical protein BAE44_0003832 [Dichanthelium oligosanthes]
MAEEVEEAVPPAAVVAEDYAVEAEAGEQQDFGLPADLVAVLPSDPFAQLDVARKITSIALSSRLGRLEAEAARLRAQLAERDAEAEDLRERVEQLDASLAVATGRLRRVEEEKLEVFKKTLVQSLQEDDVSDNTAPRARVAASPNFSSAPSDEDSALPTSKSSQLSETASSVSEDSSQVDPDAPRPPRPHAFLPSYNSTPRMTPPGSPPRGGYASVSPPRRHSISITSMNMFNDRSSGYSGHYSSPFDAASQTGEL